MKFAIRSITPLSYEDVPLLSGGIVPRQPVYAKHEKAEAFKQWWRARRGSHTLGDLAKALELSVSEVSGLMHGRYECDWEDLHRRVTESFPR